MMPMQNLLHKTNVILFLTLSLSFFCTSCDLFSWGKNNEKEKTELEKLPPPTQTGEFTFGCLVNGKAFVVTNSYRMTAIYQREKLQIGANFEILKIDQDLNGVKTVDQDINMILGGSLSEGQKYSFKDSSNYYNIQFRDFMKNSKCWFEFDDTFEGSIIFTKIDRKNFILSGEFEFSAVNDECDTVYITDGRFDMQYNP